MPSLISNSSVNPLLEGLDLIKHPHPFIMVIFGAHGDLAKRKLIPALLALFMENLLPQKFAIIGSSRTQLSSLEFQKLMREAIEKFATDLNPSPAELTKFISKLSYCPVNIDNNADYLNLRKAIQDLEITLNLKNQNVFYLSTPPSLYSPIIKNLNDVGLGGKASSDANIWPKIVVEKPFGRDLQTCKELDNQLHDVFNENQIYRIDHYLGKETVQNIMVLRFANAIFEPLWNYQHINNIQITNAETLGVEGRGVYYEEAGAMRDMVQNHMFQLLGMVAMEAPGSLDSEAIRDEKAKVLRALRPLDLNNLEQCAISGQYGAGYISGASVVGYREESGVDQNSQTETFVALKLYIDNWRWANVPFYVRSGKRLGKGITEIAIEFNRVPHRIFNDENYFGFNDSILAANTLVIQIQPDEGISLKLMVKQPGTTTHLKALNMDFKYGQAFGTRTPSAYERLILDCLLGDSTLFSRSDFVNLSWAFLDPVINLWHTNTQKNFPNYEAGSWGPESSNQLLANQGHSWRKL